MSEKPLVARKKFSKFGAPSAKEIIQRVAENDPTLTFVNLSGNAVFQDR